MSSRGATVVKLRMTPYFWRLLGKYCIILSCQTTARGGRRMSLTNTVTGIVASHLGRHAQWIEDEFSKIIREVSLAAASGFSPDYVAAVEATSSAQISDVVRAGTNPKRLARLLKNVRPLLQLGGPARVDAGRSSPGPRKVRAGRGGVASRAPLGGEDPQYLGAGGDGPFGQGDLGPQPELLQKALHDFGKFLETDDAKAIIQELDERKAAE